jgi:hypothetical protein
MIEQKAQFLSHVCLGNTFLMNIGGTRELVEPLLSHIITVRLIWWC